MQQSGLTFGNLSSHMKKLEEAGYIEVQKEFVNRRPRTLLKLTLQGKKAFENYRQKMKLILDLQGRFHKKMNAFQVISV
jgi:DNA-binding MarR family transcriptional regulator